MKKSILIALGMSVIVFLYGHVLSMSGHDHGSHEKTHVGEKQNSHSERQH